MWKKYFFLQGDLRPVQVTTTVTTVSTTSLSPHPRVFLVDDYFNNPGQIYFYFATADMTGNISIDYNTLFFDLITYVRLN